ncbi:hypothetical protein HGRIS_005706 [Hohenbuehelia grisea]|uniref:AB hydrolase-1 domain-containing protein n=1 Tax=Hohenbuehelia grisea TaxID=104357 RepID=A0ABR3JZX8_9AGAR
MMQKHIAVASPSHLSPFQVEAAQYIPANSPRDGFTLVFLHAMGLHKETFETVISKLLQPSPDLSIHDIWSIDNPNHGRSAERNKRTLSSPEWLDKWSASEYSRAVCSFLSATSHGVNFKERKLVGVAHSAGAASLMLLTQMEPKLSFHGLILLEPALLPPDKASTSYLTSLFSKMALSKRDTWENRRAAQADLITKPAFRGWELATVASFVENALRSSASSNTVTLACSRRQESAYFLNDDIVGATADAFQTVVQQNRVPIHLITCKRDEYKGKSDDMKQFQIESILKMTFSSVQHLDRGGHMYPQTEPVLTARAICNALSRLQTRGPRL